MITILESENKKLEWGYMPIASNFDQFLITREDDEKNTGAIVLDEGGGSELSGVLLDEGSEVQSILFDKNNFDTSSAKDWAQKNNFKFGDVDVKDDYIHLRQTDPSGYSDFRTSDEKSAGVKFVYGIK